MDTLFSDLIGALVKAKSREGMGHILNGMKQAFLDTDRNDWNRAINVIMEQIQTIAFSQREKFIEAPDHRPYYIASSKEADLLYIAAVLSEDSDLDPAGMVRKLEYLADCFLNDEESILTNVAHCEEILSYISEEFTILDQAEDVRLTMAFPRVAVADGIVSFQESDGELWFISQTERNGNIIESLTYEAVALLVAMEDPHPDDAIDIIEQTCNPGIRAESEEQQYSDYFEALRLGLSYHGPYADRITDKSDSEKYGQLWHDYIVGLQ